MICTIYMFNYTVRGLCNNFQNDLNAKCRVILCPFHVTTQRSENGMNGMAVYVVAGLHMLTMPI